MVHRSPRVYLLLCRIPTCNQKAKSYNKIQSLFWSSFTLRLLLTLHKTSAQTVQTLQFAQRSRNFFSVIKQRIKEPGDNSHFLFCHQPPSLQAHHCRQSSASTLSPHLVLQPRSRLLQSPTSIGNADLVDISEKAAKSQIPHTLNKGNTAHLSSHMLCSTMSEEITYC